MDDLKTLLPGEQYTLSNGETVIVSPVPFGKLRMFSDAVAKLFQKLSETGLKIDSIDDWKVIFDVAFEEILNIMSIVLDRPREWFDTIDLADGLGLLDIIIEQNFNDRAKKNLKRFLGRISGILQTQSRPSSQQVTGGQTSSDTQQSRSGHSQKVSSNSEITNGQI